MRTRTLLAALLAPVWLSPGTAPVADAAAGSYTVSACSPGAAPGGWQQINTSPATMTSGEQCGGPAIGPVGSGDAGALYGEDLVGSTTPVAPGAKAGWQLVAPAGTTITAISYYRALSTGLDLAWASGLYDASGNPLDTCASNPTPCASLNNQIPVTRSGLNTPSLFFGIACRALPPDTDCAPGSTLHYAQAQLYSANVTLAEAGAPTVSDISGTLWSGGVVSGTTPLTFSTSDVSGISQVALAGPKGAVAVQPESCNYTQTQPCPQLPEGSLSVNTTQLPDGPQQLDLFATNAAGNTTAVQSAAVVVDNNGPPPPATFTATPIAGDARAIRLTWTDPPNPPQPVTGAAAELCQTTCSGPLPVSGDGSAQLAAPGPGTYTVHFWLTDRAGRGTPTNAATRTVTIPDSTVNPRGTGTTHLPPLRLSHHLKGRELTVTVNLPKGAAASVTMTIRAYRGTRRVALLTRRVKAHHRVATISLKLSTTDQRATKLSLSAKANHARSATLVIAHLA